MTKKALSDFGSMLSVGQFVLKIGFVTSKKKGRGGGGGGGGGLQRRVLYTWQLPWLAVKRPQSALAKPSHLVSTKA